MESVTYQELYQEAVQEGIEKGKRDALAGILRARFGPLPAGLLEEIQMISSVARLDELILKAAMAGSLAELARQG